MNRMSCCDGVAGGFEEAKKQQYIGIEQQKKACASEAEKEGVYVDVPEYIDDEIFCSIDLDSFVTAKVTCMEDGAQHGESESDDSDNEEYARSIIKLDILTDDDDSELEEAREEVRKFNRGHLEGADMVMHDVRVDGHGDNIKEHEKIIREDDEGLIGDGDETDYPDTSDCESFESSDSEDQDNAVRRKRKYPVHNPKQEKPEFEVTMLFEDLTAFKNALKRYSLKERIEFKYTKNTKLYVRAKCKKPTCPWKISAKYCDDLKCVQVKSLVNIHECNPVFKNKRISADWLASNCFKDLSSINKLTLEDLKGLVKRQLQLEVDVSKCFRAKTIVVQQLRGDAKREYLKLWDYKAEIERSNPGTTVDLKYARPALGRGLREFDKMYFAFDCCKKGFLAGCRRVIGLDGCFLKGVVKGEILTAVGRDANNQMFPIAWAVVAGESTATWSWFLQLLKLDLGIIDGFGWTIMSDQQKGLENAVKEQLRCVEHRFCGRHLFANWRKKHKGLKMQRMFWSCVKSTNEVDFNARMAELKKEDQSAHDDMLKKNKEQWCKSFFNPDIKCDIVDNNLCEAFNGKIVFARAKSIITMLEDIRIYIMRRLKRNRALAARWSSSIGPRIKRKLLDNIKESHYCMLEWNGSEGYEVRHGRDRHVVKLDKRTCTCGAWMLSGIPCPHALYAIDDKGDEPEAYVAHWYKKDKYLQAYQHMMQPVAGERQWPITGKEGLLPPPYKKVKGRPKINRRREEWEQQRTTSTNMSRVGMKMTCRLCKKQGHNKKTCPEKGQGPQFDLDQEAILLSDNVRPVNDEHVQKNVSPTDVPREPRPLDIIQSKKSSLAVANIVEQGSKFCESSMMPFLPHQTTLGKRKEPSVLVGTNDALSALSEARTELTPNAGQRRKTRVSVANTNKKVGHGFKRKDEDTENVVGHLEGNIGTMQPTTASQSARLANRSSYNVITPQQLQDQCDAKRKKLEIRRKPWK